jgi:hypothetical protein
MGKPGDTEKSARCEIRGEFQRALFFSGKGTAIPVIGGILRLPPATGAEMVRIRCEIRFDAAARRS